MAKDGNDGTSKPHKRARKASIKRANEKETVYHPAFVGFFRNGKDPTIDEVDDEPLDGKCEPHEPNR